jgi:hypothetical protein
MRAMTDSYLSPLIMTARECLDAAWARVDRPAQQVVGHGVDLLSRLLDQARSDVDAYEMAELASVYDALAVQVADLAGMDTGAAFVALVVLCQDQTARQLVGGQPPPEPSHLGLLRGLLLWITVTYQTAPRGPASRTTALVHRDPGGQLRSRTTRLECGYEDLPGRIRTRMLATGQRGIRFQLYPETARGSGGLPEGGTTMAPLMAILSRLVGVAIATVTVYLWPQIMSWTREHLLPWVDENVPVLAQAVRLAFQDLDNVAVELRRAVRSAWRGLRGILVGQTATFVELSAGEWTLRITSFVRDVTLSEGAAVTIITDQRLDWEALPPDVRTWAISQGLNGTTIDLVAAREQLLRDTALPRGRALRRSGGGRSGSRSRRRSASRYRSRRPGTPPA